MSCLGGLRRGGRSQRVLRRFDRASSLISRSAVVLTVAISLPAFSQNVLADPGVTNEDVAMMVLANQSRSDPGGDGVARAAVPPLAWNEDLATATRIFWEKCDVGSCTVTQWKSLVDQY